MRWELAKIYSFRFFDDFVLIYPFYMIMFAEAGTTPAQIGILLGIWSITSFILEVPSGVAADKYSRKHILFLAEAIRALGYLTWIMFPTFWGFIAGFVLWGAKSAFTSGTFQALTYDLLKSHGQEKSYAKVIGRTKTLSYLAILAASGGAALAIPLGYMFVLTMSIIAVLLAGLSVLLLAPAAKQDSTHEREYFSILKDGFWFIIKERAVFHLVVFVAITLALGGAIDEYFPLFAGLTGISAPAIAVFLGVISAVQAVGSFFAHRFENVPIRFFYLSLALSGVLFYVAAAILNPGSLALLAIFSGMYAVSSIVLDAKIQHRIPSATRATISSMQGFLVEVGVILVYVGFGILAQILGYASAFQVFGFMIIAIGAAYLMLSAKKGQAFLRR